MMQGRIFKELDPLVETIGLLAQSYDIEATSTSLIDALDSLGLDGKMFYAKHLKIFDKYLHVFQKNRVTNKIDDFFFKDTESDFTPVIISLLISNKEKLNEIDRYSKDEINQEILDYLKEFLDICLPEKTNNSLDDIITFLDLSDLKASDKWKIMMIINNPKYYLKSLVELINSNITAFRQAESSINSKIKKLLNSYYDIVANQGNGQFGDMVASLTECETDIYPTLALPLSQIIFEKAGYYGLLSSFVLSKTKKPGQTQDDLLQSLKILSDKSKLMILKLLKTSPKYNLEIATEMELTAATVSHHMGALLSCGFVNVEKHDGRVYYSLNQDSIKDFIALLEKALL